MPYQEEMGSCNIPSVDSLIPQRAVVSYSRADYRISEEATRKCEAYVQDLIQHPQGRMVGSVDFDEDRHLIDKAKLRDVLPPGLSEQQFANVLLLSVTTEAATDTYAQVFHESDRRYGAKWLVRLTDHVWVPDETEHSEPFKDVLLVMGYAEEDLNRRIRESREKIYEHTSGDTPVQLTHFGTFQEHLTDNWHGFAGFIVKRFDPRRGRKILSVKKRETLHTMWYGDLTEILVADNPELRYQVTDTTKRFRMPGNNYAPEVEAVSMQLISLMGGDFRKIERGLVRIMSGSYCDNIEYLGEAVIDLLAEKAGQESPMPLKLARKLSQTPAVGRVVNLIAGQVVQQREGFKPATPGERIFWEATSPIRSLVSQTTEGMNFVG